MWESPYKRHYEMPFLLFTFRKVYAQDQNLFLWLYLNVGRRSKDEKIPSVGGRRCGEWKRRKEAASLKSLFIFSLSLPFLGNAGIKRVGMARVISLSPSSSDVVSKWR